METKIKISKPKPRGGKYHSVIKISTEKLTQKAEIFGDSVEDVKGKIKEFLSGKNIPWLGFGGDGTVQGENKI